jgi:hypothetical protein
MPVSGRRFVGVAGLAVALLLAWVNGVAVRWFAAQFQLFGEIPDRGDYLVGAGACVATAVLLFVAMLVMMLLRPPWWLMVATAVGVGTQLAFSITSYRHAQGLSSDPSDDTFLDGVRNALLFPGSWPLILVILVALVLALRARRRRAGRRGPASGRAPGPGRPPAG